MRKSLITLIVALFSTLGCQHEIIVPPTVTEEVLGDLPIDFFLIGEYYCYKIFDDDSMQWTYFDIQDSLYLKIYSVENGFSTMVWKINDSIISNHRIASYTIPWDLDAYNTFCYCNASTINCFDEDGGPSSVFKCYPNGINFGYNTDSIIEAGSFLRNGIAYYRRTP
jgi:hypothetical protein